MIRKLHAKVIKASDHLEKLDAELLVVLKEHADVDIWLQRFEGDGLCVMADEWSRGTLDSHASGISLSSAIRIIEGGGRLDADVVGVY